MKKELILTVLSVVVTLFVAFWGIKYFAPQLIGLPADLQLVKVGEEIAPFYEGVFRKADIEAREFILKDPLTRVRAKPLYPNIGGMGPNDILGFRNQAVPNTTDIIVIGDSQTYGNNAAIYNNWPSRLGVALKKKKFPSRIYNMSVGGWGAVQYLYMVEKALLFKPKMVVIAFYTGNDPIDSFISAYGMEEFSYLRGADRLSANDAPPSVELKLNDKNNWAVEFSDGVKTVFTPKYRYVSNQNHPAVDAGYEVMAKTAKIISEMLKQQDIKVFFTIIPTKEYVYYPKVQKENIEIREDYLQLVQVEEERIKWFSSKLLSIHDARYINVIDDLQQKALSSSRVYLENVNGHPVALGYELIGQKVGMEVENILPKSRERRIVAYFESKKEYSIFLINEEGRWLITSKEQLANNGWRGEINMLPIKKNELFKHKDQGRLLLVDGERFGPKNND